MLDKIIKINVNNTKSIPKNVRPRKDQPFYHLLAENDEITYEAYVSEQNLLLDSSKEPVKHPLIEEIFSGKKGRGKPSLRCFFSEKRRRRQIGAVPMDGAFAAPF